MYQHWKTGPNGLTRTCLRSLLTCSVSFWPWLLSSAQLLVSSLTSSQRNSFSRFDTLFDLQWPLTLNFQFETDNEKGCRIAGVSVTVGLNILFAVIGLFLKKWGHVILQLGRNFRIYSKTWKSLHSCKYSKSCGRNLLNGDFPSSQNLYLWCRCCVFTVNILTGMLVDH